jgi:hypothetical protein
MGDLWSDVLGEANSHGVTGNVSLLLRPLPSPPLFSPSLSYPFHFHLKEMIPKNKMKKKERKKTNKKNKKRRR